MTVVSKHPMAATDKHALVLLPRTGAQFALRGGTWIALRRDGVAASVEDAPAAFLPWLELSEGDAAQLIRAALAREGEGSTNVPGLPWMDIVLAGLRSPTEYWQNLALARLPQNASTAVVAELARLEKEGGSQRVRQRARAAAKRR